MSFLLDALNACRVPMEKMDFEVKKLMSTEIHAYLSITQQRGHVTPPGSIQGCPHVQEIVDRNVDIP